MDNIVAKYSLLKNVDNNAKKTLRKKPEKRELRPLEESKMLLDIEKKNKANPQFVVEYSAEIFEYLKDQEVR